MSQNPTALSERGGKQFSFAFFVLLSFWTRAARHFVIFTLPTIACHDLHTLIVVISQLQSPAG
ncbi:MAG: hypothetical protein DRI39_09280 [Chloroflexi bacterium]|nr:MAG: hypothetical protein DRI39_09280 [Chloroflexota bacterium]